MKGRTILAEFLLLFVLINLNFVLSADNEAPKKKSWKDKNILDMNDADLEHLLEQWEENDDPLEPDELPEHLRPSPQIDISKLDLNDKDGLLKMTKKGKGIMMFVNVRPEISVTQADIAMRIWHTSLHNNHIVAERYPIEDRRSIFLFPDGAQAVDAKNFLIEQPELAQVTLDGQVFQGQYTSEESDNQTEKNESPRTEL